MTEEKGCIDEWYFHCHVSNHSDVSRSELKPSTDSQRVIILHDHYQCLKCPKSFDERQEMINYMINYCPLRYALTRLKIREGEGTLIWTVQCNKCGCQFKRILSCTKHSYFSKPYKFTCGQCGVQQMKNEGKNIFTCRLCDQDELTMDGFHNHLRNNHQLVFDQTFYKCIYCFKSFPDSKELENHDC